MTKRSDFGFTLIEAMVVTILIAVIGGAAIPQINRLLDSYRLTASANLIAGELVAGRTMAISRGSVHQVAVDTGTNSLQVVDWHDANNAPRPSQMLYPGVTFVNPVPNPTVLFYSRGLARGGTIQLQNNTGTISVIVNAGGKVSIAQP